MFESIGKKLQLAREKAGFSQKKLGLMVGLSDKAISAYESGRTLPPLNTIQRIAEELQVPITDLLFDEVNDQSLLFKLQEVESKLKEIDSILNQIKAIINNKDNNTDAEIPPEKPITIEEE